jgi:hypothetical protein
MALGIAITGAAPTWFTLRLRLGLAPDRRGLTGDWDTTSARPPSWPPPSGVVVKSGVRHH